MKQQNGENAGAVPQAVGDAIATKIASEKGGQISQHKQNDVEFGFVSAQQAGSPGLAHGWLCPILMGIGGIFAFRVWHG